VPREEQAKKVLLLLLLLNKKRNIKRVTFTCGAAIIFSFLNKAIHTQQ
jgi:hypothetical protein